jgi:integrase
MAGRKDIAMKLVQELSVLQVKNLPPGTVRAVGGVPGLKVCVSDTGTTRSWIFRVQVGAKRREIGLGGFPAVGLAEAREKARRLRDEVADGKDPLIERSRRKAELLKTQHEVKTFAACALEYIPTRQNEWRNPKHKAQWLSTLRQYAFPIIGDLPVSQVGKREVLRVLQQECCDKHGVRGTLWDAKTETARRVRGRIERILDWASFHEYRNGANPARWKDYLEEALGNPTKIKENRGVRNHPALPISDVPRFFAQLQEKPGKAAEALQFLVLTASRSGEVRGARWTEVNFDKAVWTVPAERMKAHREHRVPLSREALRLLKTIKDQGTQGWLIFPSMRGTPLSDMALNQYMRRHCPHAVPHGFRSTFRDWAAEAGYAFEVCEAALAHTPTSKVVSAYLRTDLLDKRREMMDCWADYCTQTAAEKS